MAAPGHHRQLALVAAPGWAALGWHFLEQALPGAGSAAAAWAAGGLTCPACNITCPACPACEPAPCSCPACPACGPAPPCAACPGCEKPPPCPPCPGCPEAPPAWAFALGPLGTVVLHLAVRFNECLRDGCRRRGRGRAEAVAGAREQAEVVARAREQAERARQRAALQFRSAPEAGPASTPSSE